MTTQALKVTLVFEDGSQAYTLSAATDGTSFAALKDVVNSLNLYENAIGKRILKMCGSYDAGEGMFRIRNTVTNVIKYGFNGSMVKGIGGSMDSWEKPDVPITVEQNDIIEGRCNVAST